MTEGLVVGLVTAPPDVAESLANALVEGELAACVNVISGVKSVYRWKGSVETANEALLIVKTKRGLVGEISALLSKLHPDDVYELVVVDIVDGNSSYLDWLAGAVKH